MLAWVEVCAQGKEGVIALVWWKFSWAGWERGRSPEIGFTDRHRSADGHQAEPPF